MKRIFISEISTLMFLPLGAGVCSRIPTSAEEFGKYKNDRRLFGNEMAAADTDWWFSMYCGAVRPLTQKFAGNEMVKVSTHSAKADERSWQYLRNFFVEIFGQS